MPRPRKGYRVLGPYKHGRRWRVILVAADGFRSVESFTDEETAKRFAEETGKIAPGEITVLQALEQYEVHMRRKGCKERSISVTLDRIRNIVTDLDDVLNQITPQKISTAYRKRCDVVAVATHRNELVDAKSFFKWCVEEAIIPKSPATKVKPIGKPKKGKKQLRMSEARLFISKCIELAKTGDVGAVCALACIMLGLRSGEIRNRKVRDVDVCPDRTLLWIEEGKTDAANRIMEIPQPLAGILEGYAKGRRAEELLFPSPKSTGQPLTRTWLNTAVKRICWMTGVPVVCTHGLRGTWASLTAELGTPSRTLAREMGHTSEKVTRAHYIQAGAEERARVKRMLRIVNGGLEDAGNES